MGLAISYHATTCEIEIPATNIIGIKNIVLFGLFFTQLQMFFIELQT